MNEFDIIIIGGGPAGCYAALTAATKGCKVALFEEHGTIGWPRHDPGWLMESDFSASIIDAVGNTVPWNKIKEYRVCDAESGDLIETSPWGGYTVRRDLLERAIATQAVKAGASFYLSTKVLNLIRKNGKIEEVETGSDIIPRATAKIILCADGLRSAGSGFARKEKICEKGAVQSGISYLLANADVSGDCIEHFLSSDPLLHYKCFFVQGDGLSFLSFQDAATFHALKKRNDNAVSQKIQRAYPVETSGYSIVISGKYAEYFEKTVQGNMMFVGEASGGSGNIHSMIQGRFAGTVAAAAIQENDISEARLSEYHDLTLKTLAKAPFFYFSARDDFGSFHNWFQEFREAINGIEAKELLMP